jgi:tetratricopeptide (TPR) repeat protein
VEHVACVRRCARPPPLAFSPRGAQADRPRSEDPPCFRGLRQLASEDPPLAFTPKKRKTLEAAQKFAQKGSYDKALAEYEKLLKADPRDSNIRLKIGDLLLKKGDKQKALQTYTEVADMFSRGGFDAKAVAIYKQILRVDEESLEARTHLGECFQRMGLASDALREFQEAFKICQKRELKREAFELLRRVASLDPTNVANRLNLADLFARENMMDEARREYTSLLEEVRKLSGSDLVLRVAEQMRRAFPDSREALDALAWAKMQTGAQAEAAKLLKAALPKYPDDIPLRESLVTAMEASGEEKAAKNIWREIAELYKARGDVDKAREINQRHAAIASLGGSSEETTTPSILLTESTKAPKAPPLSDLGVDDNDDEIELDEPAASKTTPSVAPKSSPSRPTPVMPKPVPVAARTASAPPAKPTPAVAKPVTAPSKPAAKSSPAELLAEARVSFEFGDPGEAARLARLVLEANPDSRDARKLLADIERATSGASDDDESKDEGEGIEIERTSLADESEAESAPADDELEIEIEVPEPPPAPPAAKKPATAPKSKPALEALDPGEEFDSLPDIEIVLEDEEDRDGKFASVEPPNELGVTQPGAKPLVPKAKIERVAAKTSSEESFDIEVDLSGGGEEEAAGAAELDGDASLEFSEPLASEDDANAGSFHESSQRVQESLTEADFYLEQGLIDDAERMFKEVLARAPTHPKAMLRLGEIEARRAKAAGAKPKRVVTPAVTSDPMGDTMVREAVDEELSLTEMPTPVEIAKKAKPTPVIAKPVPARVAAKPEAKPTPVVAKPSPVAAKPVAVEPPEPAFNPAELTAEFEQEESLAAAGAEAEAEQAEDEFDLAASLEEDEDDSGGTIGTLVGVGSLGKGFADVFTAFKKGIQQQVSEGDADTHYDLAIAYKEMGLFEDAVRELETVQKTGARLIEALSLMAACKLSLERPAEAAAHLESALAFAGEGDEAAVALRYDLADALLAAGRKKEALDAFRKVAAADAKFRDVGERIAEIS